ncbi:MAG: hypothetical protein QM495_01840 [Lutibacter sp.]|uniref:hypothetical protein n=1 Tax=Lutibacter sp. TaxID=1925666 RepID=UPI00385F8B9D
MKIKYIIIVITLLVIEYSHAQEWKSQKAYQIETGNQRLLNGCWLKKDRKKQTEVWSKANVFNLLVKNGNLKYRTISQIRDFYSWFDKERKKKGHEIKGVGIASIAAKQLSKMDNFLIRFLIVRNKEIVLFANNGSQIVFKFAFPLLKKVYFSKEIIKGKKAKLWDLKYGKIEQCEILEPLYLKLSFKAIYRLEKMAKGKGIFNLGVPNELKYEGEIDNCHTRFEHGKNKLLPYYLKKNSN